jgi:hypothetical protein
MGGGLLQLVAYGAQDVYLTGNPQITFFKVVYRRHTNFAMEAIQQTFSGIPDFGNTVYCQISRNGDLIHRTYLQVKVPAAPSANNYVNYLGLRLLKTVSIEIGGQQIDKHYSDWLYIWNELSLPRGKRDAWNRMVGADNDSINDSTLFIPLEFWFCRNIGLALPLIALQYHEVKVKIEFESFGNCCVITANGAQSSDTTIKLSDANLWVEYIYLDTDERRKFAQLSHEYLIEQLQFTGQETLNNSTRVKLNFNHPCKELIWVAKLTPTLPFHWYNYNANLSSGIYSIPDNGTLFTEPNIGINDSTSNYYLGTSNINATSTVIGSNIIDNILPYNTNSFVNPFSTCLLQLNGNDRFNVRDGTYFNLVQPYQHHTNIPLNRGINVYSFAIKPEEHQPSGTLNMSRIDTAVLDVKTQGSIAGNINIYAVNYNVLRILSGMGGLAYSN